MLTLTQIRDAERYAALPGYTAQGIAAIIFPRDLDKRASVVRVVEAEKRKLAVRA